MSDLEGASIDKMEQDQSMRHFIVQCSVQSLVLAVFWTLYSARMFVADSIGQYFSFLTNIWWTVVGLYITLSVASTCFAGPRKIILFFQPIPVVFGVGQSMFSIAIVHGTVSKCC